MFYVQFEQEITYSVAEENDKLEITLQPKEMTSQKLFYVVASCFYEYQQGKISKDLGLTPVLCEDQQKTILISNGYEKQSDAQSFLDTCIEKNGQIITDQRVSVVELAEGIAPTYNSNTMADIQRAVIRSGGEDYFLDPVMTDGTYLCSLSDGSKMVFAREMPGDADGAEELWIVEQSGRKYRLNLPEFTAVSMASFSPDDSELAILDDIGQENDLFLLDIQTNELFNLGEEVEMDVTSFAWNDNSQVLYILIGQEEAELIQYDFTKETGNRIMPIVQTGQNTRDLVYINGCLYYLNPSAGAIGEIIKFQLGQKTQQTLTWGSDFSVAPDSAYLSILTYHEASGHTCIRLHDLMTGEENTIEPNIIFQDYGWTTDGTKLYYLKAQNDDTSANKLYVLCEYDMVEQKSREVLQTYATHIYLTGKPGKILLVDTCAVTAERPTQMSYLVDIS